MVYVVRRRDHLLTQVIPFFEAQSLLKRWHQESSETICRTSPLATKIWSDLHGDVQSQAEMTWPSDRIGPVVTTMSVPIRCSRRKSEEGCP